MFLQTLKMGSISLPLWSQLVRTCQFCRDQWTPFGSPPIRPLNWNSPPLRILWQTWNYDWPTDWQKDRHAHKEVPLEGWQLGDIVRKVFRGGGTSWARNPTVFRKLETLQIKLVVWLWSHVTESSAWGCDGVCLCMRDLKVYLLI